VIRLATWIVGSLAVAAVIAWTMSLPGTVTLEAAGYRMQPRLGTAVLLLLVLAVVILAIWAVLRRLLDAPKLLARHSRQRRFRQGAEHLADGFIALEAGDAARARLLARSAQSRLGDDAAARLLEARADLLLGDMPAAREHYRALIANDRTALAALAGLYQQALAQRRKDAALTFAKKALNVAPATDWARAAVFDDLTANGKWPPALAMVADEPAKSREARARQRRRQAVLETAIAREAEESRPLEALDHALLAVKLLPDFVPAALIAARINAHRGEARKAMSLLRRVWRATGHPDIASLYANAVPGASAVERLKRVRELIDTPPPSRAAAIVLARAAIDAFDWSLARTALAGAAASEPSQAVCLLMAEIEEGQNADQGKAREWLARAVKAPRDPVWTADGITADEWEPVSPVSGRLDAFEWKQPVSALTVKPETAETRQQESAAPAPPPALPGP